MIIGKYTYGNPTVIGDGNVNIGKYCSIGDNVRIITWGHHIDWISTYPFPVPLNNNWTEIARENGHPLKKDIVIGNDVWIGDSAIICYGVTIGDGAVISAGSFVTSNVKPYSVVGGNPAERLFFRFEKKMIDLLLELKWWNLPDEEVTKIIPILCSKNFDLLKNYCKKKLNKMLDFEKFDWGNDMSEFVVSEILKESLENIYEKFFEVEENDVVVDIGAFVGSFTYSILHKNPEHCWVIEPVEKHFRTLYKNLKNHQVSFVRGAISDEKEVEIEWVGVKSKTQGINFKEFITNNCIDKIDFLKLDCEGGEYAIFKEENMDYIKNNVKKIAGEFHLRTPELKEKFRYFRDNFLVQFTNYEIYSVNDTNIKWDLFNDHFIEYYQEVHFFIDNKKSILKNNI